jgi:hypothetical protein
MGKAFSMILLGLKMLMYIYMYMFVYMYTHAFHLRPALLDYKFLRKDVNLSKEKGGIYKHFLKANKNEFHITLKITFSNFLYKFPENIFFQKQHQYIHTENIPVLFSLA